MNDIVKPATQAIGVVGFRADEYGNDKIRWDILIHLPKFQMFATEKSGMSYGSCANVMEWIQGYMQDQIRIMSEKDFFNVYKKWHDEKGYWLNEDVYGQLMGE
jgi:hypothetical protein